MLGCVCFIVAVRGSAAGHRAAALSGGSGGGLISAAGPIGAEGLTAFLKDKLSAIEMPKQIEFRDELPKTLIGKLSKKELIAEEAAKRDAAAAL